MSAVNLDALADWLAEAHRSGRTCTVGADGAPRSEADAYRVQQRVLERIAFGRRPTAWKVSPPQPNGQSLATAVPSEPLRSPALIPRGTRLVLGVEAELAFRFAAPPPVGGGLAAIRAAVDEMVVLIELCETRLTNWAHAPALWKLADFQSHGAFVVGSGTREMQRDFHLQAVELTIGGRTSVSAAGSHPTCDLWAMVAWAVDHCAGRGMPLAAGDLVTTGSWTGMTPLAPGEEAVAKFAGVGEARLALS